MKNGIPVGVSVALLVVGITGTARAQQVAGGNRHSVLATGDGSVWSWGNGLSHELGYGSTANQPTPVQTNVAGIVSVSTSETHTLGLTASGVVWGWGVSSSGQLGSAAAASTEPVVVATSAIKVAAGRAHSVVLKNDGTVWSLGANSSGQLGDGTTSASADAVQAIGIAGVVAVATGHDHTLAVTSDGRVWSWGLNDFGQLGDGTTSSRATPSEVTGLAAVVAVAAGASHSLALRSDGTVWAWGAGWNGRLGIGTAPMIQATPALVAGGLTNVVDIRAGFAHSMALRADGTAWIWGNNYYGQLGNGATGATQSTPIVVDGLAGVVSVAAGRSHSLAVTGDGRVWAWGLGGWGAIGDGTYVTRLRPVPLAEPGFVWKVATPRLNPYGGAFTAPQNVTLSCATAGATIHYTLDGTEPTEASSTVASGGVLTLNQSATLRAGAWKAGVPPSNLDAASYAFSFGTLAAPTFDVPAGSYVAPLSVGLSGPAGATIRCTLDGSEPGPTAPVCPLQLDLTQSATLKAAAHQQDWASSAVTTAAYTLRAPSPAFVPGAGTYANPVSVTLATPLSWLDVHYTTDGSVPTTAVAPVSSGSTVTLDAPATLQAIAAGAGLDTSAVASAAYAFTTAPPVADPAPGLFSGPVTVSLSSTTAGSVIHYTTDGSEPTEASPSYTGPFALTAAAYVKARAFRAGWSASSVLAARYVIGGSRGSVAAGGDFSVAVDTSGAVWTWGTNGSGQLGDGTTTNRAYVARVTGLVGVVAITTGADHVLALGQDGRVWSWGGNDAGQLGDGGSASRSTPAPVNGLSGVVAVGAGARHSLAVDASGRVWTWGANASGQLGDGSTTARSTPFVLATLSDVIAVVAGDEHSLALTVGGRVWAWGDDTYGQLGNGTAPSSLVPVEIASLSAVAAVAAGARHSLALLPGGSVSAWGDDSAWQLGRADATPSDVPGAVGAADCASEACTAVLLDGVTSIAAGGQHSLATKTDGSLWTWGDNSRGQLLDNYVATLAARVSAPADVRLAVGGGAHTLVVSSAGGVWSWGANDAGQAGDGSFDDTYEPAWLAEDGFSWKTTPVVFDPPAGTYGAEQTIQLSTAMPAAVIRYTTDGSDPEVLSAEAGATGVPLAASATLTARAWATGLSASISRTATYELGVAEPVLDPPAGDYDVPQTVVVSVATPGVSMHYTLTGVEPTESDPVVVSGSALALGGDSVTTLWVKAFKPGWTPGSVVAQYRLAALAPMLSPAPGTFSTPQQVTFMATTPGAVVRFTTDGTLPTSSSPAAEAGFRLLVERNTVVTAVAFRDDLAPSQAAGGTYEFVAGPPRFFPPPGSYDAAQTVSISPAMPDATVRYTVDGSTPSASSPVFTTPIPVTESTLLRAQAFVSDWSPSAVAEGAYTIASAPIAAPVFSPAPGTFATRQQVTIVCATAGAVIHYTTDGTEPTLADPLVAAGGVVTLDGTALLKARAWSADLGNVSATRSGAYVITGAVAAGNGFSLALGADGGVRAWGVNDTGQLGDGTGLAATAPVAVSGLSGVVAVSAGDQHALALREDGSVWSWGRNTEGQLGDGTFEPRLAPVRVVDLNGIVAISAGDFHSLALAADGGVWVWGANGDGELGVGALGGYRNVPTRVAAYTLSSAVAISAGRTHSQAIDGYGRLWGWGRNYYGDVGFVPAGWWEERVATPRVSASAPTLTSVSARGALDWSLGLMTNGAASGSLVAWGRNEAPRAFAPGLDDVTVVDTGAHHMALRADGTLRDLSDDAHVPGLSNVVAVSSGATHALAVDAAGHVFEWAPGTTPSPVDGLQLTPSGSLLDADGDGLPLIDELRFGADPNNPDTNGDGIADGLAVALGLSPTDPDMDGDGVANALEIARGTDPLRADSDGDGMVDGSDCFPLDAALQCPEGAPGDTSPPIITILQPSSAVLVSSLP